MKKRSYFTLLFILPFLVFLSETNADDQTSSFLNKASIANSSYKNAMNYLHTGNIDFAGIELENAMESWAALRKDYQKTPPPAFAKDEKWAADLTQITTLFGEGLSLLDDGEPDHAFEKMQPVRGLLHNLRRRNGLILFEDEYMAVTQAMENLYTHRRAKITKQSADTWAALSKHSRAFEEAIIASDKRATDTVRRDPKYERLMGLAKTSAPAMILEVEKKNPLGFINYLRELKSVERMLYLHFG